MALIFDFQDKKKLWMENKIPHNKKKRQAEKRKKRKEEEFFRQLMMGDPYKDIFGKRPPTKK